MIDQQIIDQALKAMFEDLGINDLPEETKAELQEKMAASLMKAIVTHIVNAMPDMTPEKLAAMDDKAVVKLMAENEIDPATIAAQETMVMREDLQETINYAKGFMDGRGSV